MPREGVKILLMIDEGTIQSGERSAPIRELELELAHLPKFASPACAGEAAAASKPPPIWPPPICTNCVSR